MKTPGFFDSNENVAEYIKMAEGYDGRDLIKVLRKYLENGSSLLELGMGPGKDLDILKDFYTVTGSDNSKIFIDQYKKNNPDVDVLLLDAVEINIDKKFDCIYSNKVLHHLLTSDLEKSFQNQARVLNQDGISFHSFWYGDKEEEMSGLRFVYYTEETIKKVFRDEFDLLECKKYKEMDEGDSLYIVLRKR